MESVEHVVLVDFENVPAVDLKGIEGKPVRVTLLIGAHQKKLELGLVQQLLRFGEQVQLVEVGASGRNALDITLGYYLGVAATEHPGAAFHIVSKDKDFEPMIAHLKSKGRSVTRHNSFALPFLTPHRRTRTTTAAPFTLAKKNAAPLPAQITRSATTSPKSDPDRLAKLIAHLAQYPNLPKTRIKLEHHIASFHGSKLSPAEVTAQVEQLIKRGFLSVDAKGKASYLNL